MRLRLPVALVFFAVLTSCSRGQESKFDHSILWSVENKNTGKTSYILGTAHIMDTSRLRFPIQLVKDLINRSRYVWLEVSIAQSSQAAYWKNNLMMADPDAPKLPGCLDQKYQLQLSRILDSSKYILPSIKPLIPQLKPQALVMFLNTEMVLKSLGGSISSNFYMDQYFERFAKAADKGIISLESSKEQVQIIMQPDLEFSKAVKLLEQSIDIFFTPRPDLWDWYSTQDIAHLASMFANDSIHIKRNQNMARRLDISMKDYAVFVMVGAAHLAGKQGILTLLDQKGYIIKPIRVNF